MSTDSTHTTDGSTDPNHKVLNLYGRQITAYQNAREAAKQDLDDPTEGEIIRELSRAYTGYDPV